MELFHNSERLSKILIKDLCYCFVIFSSWYQYRHQCDLPEHFAKVDLLVIGIAKDVMS